MKFSAYFGISKAQAELDFVDIDTDADIPLFLDPISFANSDDEFSASCHTDMQTFFETVIDCVRRDDHGTGRGLLSDLHEPNETCLGWSRGRPRGRGVGDFQATQLYDRLANSEAARTGMLSDLSDCELFIEGIGPDKISDITTNIIRNRLVQYTQAQCELHGISLDHTVPSGLLWDSSRRLWHQQYARLPVIDERKVLLVPKAIVRWPTDLSTSHQKYYRHFVLNYLQQHHLRIDSNLVHVLRDKRRRVFKTELEQAYPLTKDFLYRFSRENPEVLEKYKAATSTHRTIEDREFDEDFSEGDFARALRQRLVEIPAGRDSADDFHRLMVGLLEFIFYPALIYPRKEQPIHGGRKRIDIVYTNAAKSGFFARAHTYHNITSIFVMVECRNYASDPANPELDQLSSRFSPNRGRLGLLVARSFQDRDLFIERCRDTARDSRGFIVPLADEDINQLLAFIENRERSKIDYYLEGVFRMLLQ
jgi:hypothetical protein